ncbi:RepB family plasmid replication initiator protein [Vagococcus intermedius]|uniref:RepB family plasmid replication initiator protein n=1 Tax=Vagococcus intermedius TaxID=2991418 RepID=A0AAF0CWV9_9ENTE|nr:RepB family plasmid replication initiator protein [Vagococcus intermedius]WEG74381.1 RepB family plasmid replication initiator protein [Vagococcus intermedius]WEG76503.1 RepB family plasmid replication initiator protein [Vagococcus intermedius]
MVIEEESFNRKVVQHNDLIQSVARMDKTPLKIFEIAVSAIDTNNPPKDNLIYLSKNELFKLFDVSSANKHFRFKESIKKMQDQAFFDIKEVKNEGYEFISINPLPTIRWNDYNDEVTVRFNPDIMPYLIDLKSNFTQYTIMDIVKLNSKYSITLYKWLTMHYNQYIKYKEAGSRTDKQLDSLKNPYIKIQSLRELTDTTNEYKKMNDFTKRILIEPINEINKQTNFSIKFEKIKKGRSVDGIQFFIDKYTPKAAVDYKESDNLNKKEIAEKELYVQATNSQYTNILMKHFILSATDVLDKKVMSNLQRSVYPLYDDLRTEKGIDGVVDHIEYVANHKIGYDENKQNIVKYLKKSIEQYLVNIKINY